MKFMSVLCALLLLTIAPPAGAAEADDASLAKARELMAVTGSETMLVNSLNAATEAFWPVIIKQHPNLTPEIQGELRAEMRKATTEEMKLMLDSIADIYAANLTVEEMEAMIGFYRSPAGRSLLAKMPTILRESMKVGVDVGQRIGERAGTRAVERLRARGVIPADADE